MYNQDYNLYTHMFHTEFLTDLILVGYPILWQQ